MNNKPSFTSVHEYNTFRDGELSQAQSMQNERQSIEHMKKYENEDNMKTFTLHIIYCEKTTRISRQLSKHISKYLKLKIKYKCLLICRCQIY